MLISGMRPRSEDFYRSAAEFDHGKNKDHAMPKIGAVGSGKRTFNTLMDILMSDEALNGDLNINI